MDRSLLRIGLIACMLSLPAQLGLANPSAGLDAVEQDILNARTYAAAGLDDERDHRSFQCALHFLDRAEARLQASEAEDEVADEDTLAQLSATIESLREDIEGQAEFAAMALGGRFPLVRFLGTPPFIESDALKSWIVAEAPLDIGAERAAVKLGDRLQGAMEDYPQIAAIVTSPHGRFSAMESMVRMVLTPYSRVRVHQPPLTIGDQQADFYELLRRGEESPSDIQAAREQFGDGVLAIVEVDRLNEIEDNHFVTTQTRVFEPESAVAFDTIVTRQVVRDNRASILHFFTFAAVSAGAAILVFSVVFRRSRGRFPGVGHALLFGAGAYAFGFIAAQLIGIVLGPLRPGLQTHIWYSAWWPILVLVAMTWIPALLVRNVITRIPALRDQLGVTGKKRLVLSCSGIGAAVSAGYGLFLYYPLAEALPLAISAALFFGACGYIGGAFFDELDKRLLVPLLLSLLLLTPVAAYLLASGNNPELLATVSFATFLLIPGRHIRFRSSRSAHSVTRPERQTSEAIVPDDLAAAATAPPLLETRFFHELLASVRSGHQRPPVFCLKGEAGLGKSATAEGILTRIQDEEEERGTPVLVLRAHCEPGSGEDEPYLPIHRILTDYFHINPGADQQAQLLQVDKVLDGVMGSFIPFSSILFPQPDDATPSANTDTELLQSICRMFEKLAERHRVVLYIDDVHWADQATLELLSYLHSHISEATCDNSLLLYTSRPSEAVNNLFSPDEILDVPPMSEEERELLLSRCLGIESESARTIANWTRESGERTDNLFWLLKAVEHLARNEHLVLSHDRYQLRPEIASSDRPPLPKEYEDSIRLELEHLREFKTLLAAAAAVGMEFDADVIARSLDLDVLECLTRLQNLEEKSTLIYDVRDKDGAFAFSSNFSLEAVRRQLGVNTNREPDRTTPQLVRELHFRIARTLEDISPKQYLLAIAEHYYAAGIRCATSAIEHGIEAARYCTRVFRFDEARRFLERVRERKEQEAGTGVHDLQILACECDIAHVEGANREEIAHKCQRAIDRYSELSTPYLILFARTFYDARMFEQCYSVAYRAEDQAETALERAEARHFIALSHPPSEPENRRQELEQALHMLDSSNETSTRPLYLKAQILNSLGEAYAALAERETGNRNELRQAARRCFEESIEIKNRQDIQDTPGLAMSYGGLGRLELFVEPVNIALARENLLLDLEFSEQIGDITGQTIMHSLLGYCALLEEEVQEAAERYERSLGLSTNSIGQFHAFLGLLRTLARKPSDMHLRERAFEFAEFLRTESLPQNLYESVLEAMNTDGESLPDDVLRSLKAALQTHS